MTKDNPWTPTEIPPDITRSGVYVGRSGYHYDDWIGVFNPHRAISNLYDFMTEEEKREQDGLRFYQRYFSFVEINDTFYKELRLPHFLDIQMRSKDSMQYSVKAHKNSTEILSAIGQTSENSFLPIFGEGKQLIFCRRNHSAPVAGPPLTKDSKCRIPRARVGRL